ncbi:MAG TPA: amidohydrolase family protein [Pyrinomonadaceae bacterium]|nr:amidohydrolase family protein [Pyrinomonadaceae bacterium]
MIDPRAMSKVMMGVTTKVMGEGGSVAPMNERLIEEDRDFYNRYKLDVDWRTLGEYFDGPLAGSKSHPRGWGSYARVLSRYVRDEKLLTLEQAIHKMTGLPAKRVGLRDRGVLRAGAFADITVFDPARVRDLATFEEPNRYAEGVEYVFVNGQFEVDGGRRTEVNAGRPLRGSGYRSNTSTKALKGR